MASPGVIIIDADAAGYGWFIDATPAADEELDGDGPGVVRTQRVGAVTNRVGVTSAEVGREQANNSEIVRTLVRDD